MAASFVWTLPLWLLGPPLEPFDGYQPPEALPLDVAWGATIDHAGVAVRSLRFTSLVWQGTPIRVYALYAAPPGAGPHPTVLHLHGGGQTASAEDVVDLVRHGYACLSYDWTGLRDDRRPEEVTVFPAGLGDLRRVSPEPRWSHVVQVVVAARRALDVLCAQPGVDARRLGVYGISWGGFCTFLLNALEPRLQCALPVYCCSWMPVGQEQHDPYDPWHRWFEPYQYTPFQQSPLMYLSGTNDFSGIPDKLSEIWARATVDRRLSYTLHTNHHLAAPQAEAGYRWLAQHLQGGPALPPSPRLELFVRGGRLQAAISAPQAQSVRLAVSPGTRPGPQRFWYEVPAQAVGGGRFGPVEVPVYDPAEPLWILASAAYDGGFELSSDVEVTSALARGARTATFTDGEPLFDPSRGAEGWCESAFTGGTQLYSHRNLAVRWSPKGGPDGGPHVWVDYPGPVGRMVIGFRGPAATARSGAGAAGLRLSVAGGPRTLQVIAHSGWLTGSHQTWVAQVPRESLDWTTLEVPREQFRNADGALDDCGRIDFFEFAGGPVESPPRFGALAWRR